MALEQRRSHRRAGARVMARAALAAAHLGGGGLLGAKQGAVRGGAQHRQQRRGVDAIHPVPCGAVQEGWGRTREQRQGGGSRRPSVVPTTRHARQHGHHFPSTSIAAHHRARPGSAAA